MNFGGSAAFWMQSIEADLRKCTWEDLCKDVVGRFEQDQYNYIIRQFFHVKQSGSVVEYVEIFDDLVHQLLAYDPCFSPTVITSRFVNGLKPSIKAVVLLHRPKDLDTASSLAILQEEVLLGHPTFETRCNDNLMDIKPFVKPGLPSVSSNKNIDMLSQSEKRGSSLCKGKVQSDKLAALMAYRKAKGLCYKCGLKWGSQHKCPESVALNVVEELWQMISQDDVLAEPSQEDSDSGEDLMALSDQAVQGTCIGKTIKLAAHFGKHSAVVLLDSGSSHNFISEQLAACLPNWQLLQKPLQVKVANDSVLICTHEVTCAWLVQGVQFETTFRILPLQCYDSILGMDWLEQFNPMQIHWVEKWLSFTYKGAKV